jgi:hypothetical protein
MLMTGIERVFILNSDRQTMTMVGDRRTMTIELARNTDSISTTRTFIPAPSPPSLPALSLSLFLFVLFSYLLSSHTPLEAGISALVPQQIVRTTSPRSAIIIKCKKEKKISISKDIRERDYDLQNDKLKMILSAAW